MMLVNGRWRISHHARERMAEREVTAAELSDLLANPGRTIPDPKRRPGCRLSAGGGIVAIVNEDEYEVITVGYDGATSRDWKLYQRRWQPVVDVDQEPAKVPFATRRRPVRRVAPTPVTSFNVLDDVHMQGRRRAGVVEEAPSRLSSGQDFVADAG